MSLTCQWTSQKSILLLLLASLSAETHNILDKSHLWCCGMFNQELVPHSSFVFGCSQTWIRSNKTSVLAENCSLWTLHIKNDDMTAGIMWDLWSERWCQCNVMTWLKETNQTKSPEGKQPEAAQHKSGKVDVLHFILLPEVNEKCWSAFHCDIKMHCLSGRILLLPTPPPPPPTTAH